MAIRVSKLAIVYDPPTLIVEYVRHDEKLKINHTLNEIHSDYDTSDTNNSYRHKKINLQHIFLTNNKSKKSIIAKEVANNLINDYSDYFGLDQVPSDKLVELLDRLFSRFCDGNESHICTIHSKKQDKSPSLLMEQSLSDDINQSNDATSNNDCPLNIDFSYFSSSSNNDIDGKNVKKCLSKTMEDLNNVSEERLEHAKKEMDVTFTLNRILPGQENYEYDKRVDYEATSDSSWD